LPREKEAPVVNKGDIRTDKPPVSIVIVNYNSGMLLTECVRSTLPQASEILVIDNASKDESIEACIRQVTDPRLKVIYNKTNLGFAAACNQGFSLSQSKYILFLNPDCCLEEETIAKLLPILQADCEVGMVGGLLINPDGTEQPGGRRSVPTPWRSFVRAFGLYKFSSRWPRLFSDFILHQQPLPDEPIEVEAISGACTLVKREAVDVVGLWDDGYFLHCEDLDWCMRFRQKGWKILFVPDAIITHHKGGCRHTRPFFVEWHKHKGMVYFYRKFFRHQYPGMLMWLVVVGVWLHFTLIAGFYSLNRIKQLVGQYFS
jgi:GT2 family glycosyltransferase